MRCAGKRSCRIPSLKKPISGFKYLYYAARIVKLNQYFSKEKKERIISKQIIRSGTSIGANANEAAYGVSQADFISKMQVALKENAETNYWLKLFCCLIIRLTNSRNRSLTIAWKSKGF